MALSKFVICIENTEYPASLEQRKIYQVIPDATAAKINHIRILDESGDDYLFPATCFIDAHLPKSVEAALVQAA